jgi:hypothetical protein
VVDARFRGKRSCRGELLAGLEVAAIDRLGEAVDELLRHRRLCVAIEVIQSEFV